MRYPQLIAERPGAVVAYESAAQFLDVGTPRDYFDTVTAVARREGRPLDVGADCRIAASARLRAQHPVGSHHHRRKTYGCGTVSSPTMYGFLLTRIPDSVLMNGAGRGHSHSL